MADKSDNVMAHALEMSGKPSRGVMAKQHIATYAILGAHTGRRVGTGYVYDFAKVEKVRLYPNFRWRNEECRVAFLQWAAAKRCEGVA